MRKIFKTKEFNFRNFIVLKKSLLVIFTVLFLDQLLKIWIKTHMYLGQEYNVFGNWFIIHFTENNGMAFGMEFAGGYGKLFLTLFRIIASGAIFWYLLTLIKKKVSLALVLTVSLIFAGAVGNIIDSAFYGLIFNESAFQVAQLFPDGGGYGSLLHGKVVDMLYFPVIETHFPQWFPFWGGEEFVFFRPVFNLADSSITVGVLSLLIFQKKFFKTTREEETINISDELPKPE
jgi:signal peptidase II